MALSVDIEKRLGDFNLNVEFEAVNTATALLGASGSGKSVTLRCIAGIMTPDRGRIVLNGRVLFDSRAGIDLPPQERRVGYLFQQYALFPNMTVEGNISRVIHDRRERRELTESLISQFQLQSVRKLRPPALSGGQQQRTALARIFASKPEALLLDEPFSALDSYLKAQLEQELRDLLDPFGGDVVWVTHDRDEVYRNCGRVCVIDGGVSQPTVTPEELFTEPRTVSAARLSGCKNILPATAGADGLFIPAWGLSLSLGRPAWPEMTHAGLRAHHIRPAQPGEANAFPCMVERVMDNVFSTILILRPEGAVPGAPNLRAEVEKDMAPEPGRTVFFSIQPEKIILLR